MNERSPTLDPEEITKKWDGIIKSGHTLSDADFFNFVLEIFQSRSSKKRSTSDEIRLSSSGDNIIIDYFPADQNLPETIWIEIDEGKGSIAYNVQKQNDGFRIFLLEGLEKDPRLIFLTGEKRIEIAKRLLEAHKLTPLKHRAVSV